MRREAGDIEIAAQPEPLSHPGQRWIGERAREMARGVHVLAPRPLHRDPQRVIDVAARDLVVSDDRRQDRQACGIGGRPSSGRKPVRVQIEGDACDACQPASVRRACQNSWKRPCAGSTTIR